MEREGMLEAMVCRIVSCCDRGHGVGRVMICRLCYFSDFGSFELRGDSVTGSPYILGAGGPEPVGIDRVLSDMVRRRALRMTFSRGTASYSVHQGTPIPALGHEDTALVDRVLSEYSGVNERLLSWLSREDAPCVGRHVYDRLDYASVSLRDCRTSAKTLQRGEA